MVVKKGFETKISNFPSTISETIVEIFLLTQCSIFGQLGPFTKYHKRSYSSGKLL